MAISSNLLLDIILCDNNRNVKHQYTKVFDIFVIFVYTLFKKGGSMLNTMTAGAVRLRIPDILKERGMTVSDLARVTGLTFNTASALSRGFYDRIGLNTISMLCAGLNVQPGDLFVYRPELEKPEIT
jgi:putative transcriptional regulator